MNKYKKLVSNTLIFAIGSFGSKILLLLLTRLYTGNINPGDNSTKELLEQTANFLIPIITFSIADAVIRYGIDKNFDNRKIFTSACGSTTVPMSRPSITTLWLRASSRCISSRKARTSGMAETTEAQREISGRRMTSVTSSPLSSIRCRPSSP